MRGSIGLMLAEVALTRLNSITCTTQTQHCQGNSPVIHIRPVVCQNQRKHLPVIVAHPVATYRQALGSREAQSHPLVWAAYFFLGQRSRAWCAGDTTGLVPPEMVVRLRYCKCSPSNSSCGMVGHTGRSTKYRAAAMLRSASPPYLPPCLPQRHARAESPGRSPAKCHVSLPPYRGAQSSIRKHFRCELRSPPFRHLWRRRQIRSLCDARLREVPQ
jgi:hypothetical protein